MICETLLALSLHFSDGDFNSTHPHARCITDNNVITGVYYNSQRDLSVYIGKNKSYKYFDIEYNLVTGYNSFLTPMIRIKRGVFWIAPMYEEEKWITRYPTYNVVTYGDKHWTLVMGVEFKL